MKFDRNVFPREIFLEEGLMIQTIKTEDSVETNTNNNRSEEFGMLIKTIVIMVFVICVGWIAVFFAYYTNGFDDKAFVNDSVDYSNNRMNPKNDGSFVMWKNIDEEATEDFVDEYPQVVQKSAEKKNKRSTMMKFEKSRNSIDESTASKKMRDPHNRNRLIEESSFDNFYKTMDQFALHIDRLEERFMTINELNDDYVSREFSVESTMKNSLKS